MKACLTHSALRALEQIRCPVLVIGGEGDRIVGPEASREIAARIEGARLHMYARFGHGAYEEAPDFQQRVFDFLAE